MNAIRVIFPYLKNDVWMFDDAAVGLCEEPFVCGIPAMIDRLVATVQDAERGFALYFSDQAFPGFQLKVDRAEPEQGGTWYTLTLDGATAKGWLCPALFKYFDAAPEAIYVKAEPRRRDR